MKIAYYGARLQNDHLASVWLICILSFLCGCNRDEWCIGQCRSTFSSSKDTVDKYPSFVIKMKCCTNIKKSLDSVSVTHTITSRLVLGKSRTSIYFFQNGILPLLYVFSHSPSQVCKVFNCSLILIISWSSKSIAHLHSACCSNCFAPSQHPPTPIPWCIDVAFCEFHTVTELCILLRYWPSEVIAGYKN